jgi:hypothetical protein
MESTGVSLNPGLGLDKIVLSLSTWFLALVGVIIIRAESHAWVNIVMLTVIFPVYTWIMSRNNILGSTSQGAIIGTVIGAGLLMTLLLEVRPNSKFAIELKKDMKEFGKNIGKTAYASIFIVLSLIIGTLLTYAVLQNNFIEM